MTGLSYNTGLFIFAATVVLYTTIGGFRAVALTDAVQGVVMIIGTTALLFGVIKAGGRHPKPGDLPPCHRPGPHHAVRPQ